MLAEFKLWADDPGSCALHRLESLEALSLGIEGKASLWTALSAAADATPTLRVCDYGRLLTRARDQRTRVDARRVAVAPATLAIADFGQ